MRYFGRSVLLPFHRLQAVSTRPLFSCSIRTASDVHHGFRIHSLINAAYVGRRHLHNTGYVQLPTTTLRWTTELPNKVGLDLVPSLSKESVWAQQQTQAVSPAQDIPTVARQSYADNTKTSCNVLRWEEPPRNVLIIKKPRDEATNTTLVNMAQWLRETFPAINIILEADVARSFLGTLPFTYIIPDNKADEYTRVVDFVITLGGDGTVLHVSSLFPQAMPPVISFSMGTLGFLLPFHIHHFREALTRLICGQEISLLLRMRLACSMHQSNGEPIAWHGKTSTTYPVMNEVHVHRGRFPHLTSIDCYVDNEFLTNAVADGLIVGTPTGSTAYSLSAGGPIVHPTLDSLLLTPICPRSLSFRTILLPSYSVVQLRITVANRGIVEVSLDGGDMASLRVGQYIQVQASPYPVPCVNRISNGVDWSKDINELLKFNQNFANKQQLLHDIDQMC
ncbi:NADH kinase pos5 [Dispira simplex]|nr:NADH kinase pos5 [Dispira simplex]